MAHGWHRLFDSHHPNNLGLSDQSTKSWRLSFFARNILGENDPTQKQGERRVICRVDAFEKPDNFGQSMMEPDHAMKKKHHFGSSPFEVPMFVCGKGEKTAISLDLTLMVFGIPKVWTM